MSPQAMRVAPIITEDEMFEKGRKRSPTRRRILSSSVNHHHHLTNNSNNNDSSESDSIDKSMPKVYRLAREFEWGEVASELRYSKRSTLGYVNPNDGTTILHLAVMSRTGYNRIIHAKEGPRAPLCVIDQLVRKFPKAGTMPCYVYSYTPLAYACLVLDQASDLRDMEQIVRVLLEHCPESTQIFTSGGLSPLDVHIVSHSQLFSGPVDDDEQFTGLSDTVVLRTLLEQDSSLAHPRGNIGGGNHHHHHHQLDNDAVIVHEGPIELLYRSNVDTFLASSLGPDPLQKVTKWWVWRWMILLLKYATRKLPGTRFCALHAAAALVGCPSPVITLAMRVFPKQAQETDEMHLGHNLSLHSVCSWPSSRNHVGRKTTCTSEERIPIRKSDAIHALLQSYPDATRLVNDDGQTPLELAVSSGTTWDFGVRRLCRANPKAVTISSPTTGLFPFMTAAVAAGISSRNQNPLPIILSKRSLMAHIENLAKQDLQSVRTIYGLLRINPNVLIQCTSTTRRTHEMNKE